MIEGVIVGLVTAGALGLARLARSIIGRARSRKTPLRVIADIAESESWTLVLPGALPGTDHPQDSATSDVYRWLRSRGAVSYIETRVRLRIEGMSPEAVTVTNMAVEMDRLSPLSGVRVHCPTAGALASTLLIFDLDEEHPIAWEWVEDMGRERIGETPHFNRHSYAITHGEVVDLQIVGRTRNAYYRWRLNLICLVGGKEVVVAVDDHGHPFETTGEPRQGFMPDLDWAWYEGGGFRPPPDLEAE